MLGILLFQPPTKTQGILASQMNTLLNSLKLLGPAKLVALAVTAAAILGGMTVFASYNRTPSMALLYKDLDPKELSDIGEALDKANIRHTESNAGDSVLVPASQVAQARLLLAKSGLPDHGSIGYELFDHTNSLTTGQFEQKINETRALEGELERSIRLIDGIKNARVHIVLPHRELFSSTEQDARASVLLTTGHRSPERDNVDAIVNLVSAAIPDLKPENISVIDNHGTVLSHMRKEQNENNPDFIEAQRHQTEEKISRDVEEILIPALGTEHVKARASVTMDMDETTETQELYDPDQQVLRSQQVVSSKDMNSEPRDNTSVNNNLPNATNDSDKNVSQSERREETNNYETGKTVKTIQKKHPKIGRVSLAVLVDWKTSTDKDGKSHSEPLSEAEIAHISDLAKSASGYNSKRGDEISVVSMKFSNEDDFSYVAPKSSIMSYVDYKRIMKFVIPSVFIIVILFAFVRPIVRKNSADTNALSVNNDDLDESSYSNKNNNLQLDGRRVIQSENHIISGNGAGDVIKYTDESELHTRNSFMKRSQDIVSDTPSLAVSVIREWMNEGKK